MGMWFVRRLWVGAMIGAAGLSAAASQGAYLSEIWLGEAVVRTSHDATPAPVGPLIEIAGIDRPGPMDLVILDATAQSANYGRILQVIPFSPIGEIHTVTGGQEEGEALAFLNVLGEVGRRSIVLFAGRTGLSPLDGSMFSVSDRVATVPLVDVVTFGDPGRTRALGLEVVLDATEAQVLIRPMTPLFEPMQEWLSGPVDRMGRLTGEARGYPTSPGRMNAVLIGAHAPEPSSGFLCGVLGILAAARRGRGLKRGLRL